MYLEKAILDFMLGSLLLCSKTFILINSNYANISSDNFEPIIYFMFLPIYNYLSWTDEFVAIKMDHVVGGVH
jgi:hypothetical protein